jgi:hypothetical protein
MQVAKRQHAIYVMLSGNGLRAVSSSMYIRYPRVARHLSCFFKTCVHCNLVAAAPGRVLPCSLLISRASSRAIPRPHCLFNCLCFRPLTRCADDRGYQLVPSSLLRCHAAVHGDGVYTADSCVRVAPLCKGGRPAVDSCLKIQPWYIQVNLLAQRILDFVAAALQVDVLIWGRSRVH